MNFFAKSISTAACSFLMFVSSVALADNVTFNYQGRVKVQSQAYTGTGLLKLAILNSSGTAVLWSNDGTIGTGGGPDALPVPTSSVAVPVSDGVFSVSVGDSSVTGMAPLDSAVMVSDTPLRLRVCFSNGELGFQELKPDHKLTDLSLVRTQTGTSDFTIYVNGTTGNDANNGLTPETAKKTISGAVDILPEKIRCNITVSIAPGTYREMVLPHDHSVTYGKTVRFVGDTSWTPSGSGNPSVIIDGADVGSTPVRDYAFYARQCTGITIEGITFQNTKLNSLKLEDGNFTVRRCLAQEGDSGFDIGPQAYAVLNECKATKNESNGFVVHSSSRASLTTCTATENSRGLFAVSNSTAQMFGYNNMSSNKIGVQTNTFSSSGAHPGTNSSNRTHISDNTEHAVVVNWHSHFTPYDAVMQGNAALYLRYYGTIIGVDPQ